MPSTALVRASSGAPSPDASGAPASDPATSVRAAAEAALTRQLATLERLAEDEAAEPPHRLRAVEMIAALAGQAVRGRGPRPEGGPPGGPAAKHAAKHASKHAAKHARKHASKHARSAN